jgi:divalent metal cation (Fe/Co/Zn/Cd) transporter
MRRHLLTDVWTSAAWIVGVGLAAATGWLCWTPCSPSPVAANILREGVHLMWKSTEGLMDSALEPELLLEIDRTLEQFRHPTIRFDHCPRAARASGAS